MSHYNDDSAPAEQSRPHISNTLLWQYACESFMAGVFHSIGSRVSALSGIATMAAMGGELDGTLLSLLDDEVEHLTHIMEASRLLPRAPATLTGPCHVAAILPGLMRLVELDLDARRLEVEYDGPDEGMDVELDRTTVTHSLAVLLRCLIWRAERTGADKLSVSLTAHGDHVELRAALGDPAAEQPPESVGAEAPTMPPARVIEEGLESIVDTATAFGGSLELESGVLPSSFVYRLPKLSGA